MFVSDDDKVYLEVPEACRVTGLSKSQIYKISGQEIPSKKDPRNNSRTLLEAEEVFLAREELENQGSVGNQSFRKWDDVDFSADAIVRSIVNKMYRNRYDLKDLDLLQLVNRKRRKKTDKDSQEFQQQYEFVKDRCFGWANPECEECSEHCDLFQECLEERYKEVLPEIAEKFRTEDEVEELEKELDESVEDIEAMEQQLDADLEEIEDF